MLANNTATSEPSATTEETWPSTAEALATLQTAKLVVHTNDLTGTKLAKILFKYADTLNTRMKQDAVDKAKKVMRR
jgi:hypothetical protein